MSSILGRLLDFRSKEEKERSYETYAKRIFPYGDDQKDRIAELLTGLFPKQNSNYVLMYYILIKERITGEEQLNFETAAKKVKGSPVRSTPELKVGIQALLNIDLNISENLEYPTLEELRDAIDKQLHS